MLDYEIHGHDLQLVEIKLKPQEGIRAETGAMIYMQPSIAMDTTSPGGLLGGIKRMVSGAGFFLNSFRNTSDTQIAKIAFAAPYPGKVLAINLAEHHGQLLCHKESFLCAGDDVAVEVAFTQRLGTGFFGGNGFILQKLSGTGLVFVHGGGMIIQKELAAGEELRVDVGCLLGFEATVNYDIQFVGGIKNTLFGGEGVFFVRLAGPGKIYLQSLPFSRLADRIISLNSMSKQR
ncbi:MAG: TIGR00266 family protein [Gammaproteobacteria bacterium]|nr:TIGR00266 family protein [Gammaproteobacteria bacterium]